MHWIDDVSAALYYDETKGRYQVEGLDHTLLEKTWHDMLQAFCSPGYVGELYTSNAPYDPLFWVIHTAGERLLAWRRILNYNNRKDLDETWGYTHPSGVPSDTGVVCDWSRVVPGISDFPECKEQVCTGHNADDLLPSEISGETYTNQAFYNFMDPYNEDLPYLYDNFKYSHCDAQGVKLSENNFFG